MPITICSPARRKCPVCHDHVIRKGFYLSNAQGYTQFRCSRHVGDMLKAALKTLGANRVEK